MLSDINRTLSIQYRTLRTKGVIYVNASRFKWTYEQEKTLIELYDQAISMNDYTLKDPTVLGREHMVDNFNHAFNLNINYAFFKNKLDDF
ncbi:hypothetical protein YC2023_107818 [Brassica napus]